MKKFSKEVKDAVQWTIQIGAKKEGRWRVPVVMKLQINPEFIETYNPELPKWRSASFFKGTIFQEDCRRLPCSTCRKDLLERLGFIPYQEEDPSNTNSQTPCLLFHRKGNSYIAEFFLDWKQDNNYEKEMSVLVKVVQSLEKEVLKSLYQAYHSEALDKIIITNKAK